MIFQDLALRMGIRVEDLRALLRRTPGIPDEMTLRKGVGEGAPHFAQREVPPALAELLLGMMKRGDVRASSRVRLRRLGARDLVGPVAALFERPAEDLADEVP